MFATSTNADVAENLFILDYGWREANVCESDECEIVHEHKIIICYLLNLFSMTKVHKTTQWKDTGMCGTVPRVQHLADRPNENDVCVQKLCSNECHKCFSAHNHQPKRGEHVPTLAKIVSDLVHWTG